MGLFTAYHASERFGRVVVLERGRIGDPMTASFGRTRSFRNDYLDATYARLAHEAFRLWGAFEARTATKVLVRCGCLNVAKRSVTPSPAVPATVAKDSYIAISAAAAPTHMIRCWVFFSSGFCPIWAAVVEKASMCARMLLAVDGVPPSSRKRVSSR